MGMGLSTALPGEDENCCIKSAQFHQSRSQKAACLKRTNCFQGLNSQQSMPSFSLTTND
jgi:hypothetical protein